MAISTSLLYRNPLWRPLIHVGDYFARLGGSGRFDSFYEWHCPGLVLMCCLELNAPLDVFNEVKSDSDISEKLWTQTNGLSNDVKAILSQSTIGKEDIEQFIVEVTKRIEKNTEPRPELRRWLAFVDSFKSRSANLH